jgi:chromosome segregation ATPase
VVLVQASQRIGHLEKELHFYQQQAAEAMQSRDQADEEVAELKEGNLDLQKRLGAVSAQLRKEEIRRADFQLRLESQEEQVRQLNKRAELAEKLPAAESLLAHLKGELRRVHDQCDELQVCFYLFVCYQSIYMYIAWPY